MQLSLCPGVEGCRDAGGHSFKGLLVDIKRLTDSSSSSTAAAGS